MIGIVLCAAVLAQGADQLSVSHRKVTASDGVALALYRYAPAALVDGQRAVVLIPDFGMTRAAFDFQGDGLARWLAARGRLTYVAELRGQGKAAGVGWSPAQVVERDLPAIAAAIPGGPFDLVVQGWSGTLVLAATTRELKGRVARVVALNTPAEFSLPSTLAETVLRAGGKVGNLGNDADGARAFELLFALGAKIRAPQLSALRSAAFVDLGATGSAGLLGWMKSGDLALADGDTVKARLARYDLPTLQFLGLADGWANPELCSPLREVSKAKVTLRTFSRFEPVAEDYSHLSMLLGAGAPKDLFAPALAFLDRAADPGECP